MKRVYICSPYRGNVKQNIHLAMVACAYALKEGYAPIAPHLLYPHILDDATPEEREIGINAGLAWIEVCDEFWICGEKITEGMAREIKRVEELGIPARRVRRYDA